jgi:LacI family transcriptional regulator
LLHQKGFPLVLIDRYFPTLEISSVAVDNEEAAYRCTAHLVETGCRRIGMIGFKTTLYHLQDRKKGFVNALKDRGITAEKENIKEVSLDASREEVEQALAQLLAGLQPIDALFFASNKLSTFGLKYINTLKLRVPEDLAICSFDQSDATELFYATLTHVRQPMQEMGRQAVRLLLQGMNNGETVEQVRLPAELVIGQSTQKGSIKQ